MRRKHFSSGWGLSRLLALSVLTIAASFINAQTCNWTSPGQATVGSHPARPIAGPSPSYPFTYNWVVSLVNTINSKFVVTGVSNENLPDGGPASQPSCPQWPSLYSATADNHWTDSWSGTQEVNPGEMWEVAGVFDVRGGTGWITHVPSTTKYTRALDMDVFEYAYFREIDPGELDPPH